MIIDTHCHFDRFNDPETFIAGEEGKGNIIIGMTNLPSHFEIGYSHLKGFKHIRLALGFHPLLADDSINELFLFDKLVNLTSYIGEIGLDFSREGYRSKLRQLEVLSHILSILKGKNKIISVHSRRAERELLDLLIKFEIKNVIFHWYSGPVGLIQEIASQGYYFSVNEAMTISENGKKILKFIPRDRMLTETDAPYNDRCNISNVLSALKCSEGDIKNNFYSLVNKLNQ